MISSEVCFLSQVDHVFYSLIRKVINLYMTDKTLNYSKHKIV